MKKRLACIICSAALIMSFTACGGGSGSSAPVQKTEEKSKLTEIDGYVDQINKTYDECAVLLEQINLTGYEDVQAAYDELRPIFDDIEVELDGMNTAYAENRDTYTDEELDNIITECVNMITSLDELKTNAQTMVDEVVAAISEDQALLEQGALANVDIYQVPQLTGTTWTLVGGIADGVELEDADLQAVLESAGGQSDYVFSGVNDVELQTGNGPVKGKYLSNGEIIEITFENGSVFDAAFTAIDGDMVMILIASEDLNSGLYYMAM